MKNFFKHGSIVLMGLSLASCVGLPASGPNGLDVEQKAAIRVSTTEKSARYNYVLMDVSKSIIPYFEKTFVTSLARGFSGGPGGAPGTVLGVGDVIQVSVFESQSGGLFIPNDAGSRPGNYITLPPQTIDRTGMIKVPYAGEVRASGRTSTVVQADIEERLANRAIEPQVVITTTTARSTTVAILGDVNRPGKYDLSPAGDRVLDIVSQAGGLTASSKESFVTIERGGRRETALFRTIIDNPRENVYVRAGDTVYVSRDRRTYGIFGAANSNGRINFEDSDLTLAEALAEGGGLLDSRAEPEQVYLYRIVDRKTLISAGVNLSKHSEEMVPVIFKANLRDPETFFALQKFRMQDKDIIYISSAVSTDLEKFLDVVNGVTDTVHNVRALRRN